MDGAKEGWDDLKATWQEARRCRQVATSMLGDSEALARVDRRVVQDTVRIASLNAEEMRHGGAAGSVADSSDLSDWYPTMAMATRKLVVGFDHDVSRVLMDSSELVGESDVENWPVWRCKVQKPGALEIKRNQAKIFAGPDRILIKYTTNILKNQLSLVLHPHEILGAELIEVQHKRQSSDAGRDRGKNDLRSNWESLFSKPNKKFVVVMHVLTVPSVMDPEAGVSSYQEFEISSFRDANGTILPDKQHLEQACKLRDAIKLVASERAPLLQYARPLRVIVNPISGHRKGRELFGRVEHLFKKADVPMETTFTSYAGHARMIILGGEHEGKRVPPLSPRSYCGVLVIGGDGTVCEVVNAMLEREDWEELVESLPVGTIPAGSECAFAKMISFVDPLGAAWVLLKGHRVGPVDMLRVTQGSRILYCLCGIGWGIPGKLAEESEALREVYGPARYLVSGLRSFLELRGCEGRLEILTPKEEEEEEFSETCRFAGVCEPLLSRLLGTETGERRRSLLWCTWQTD
ncbi:hypothetical protein GUITHDRAFT_120265 [Guillardia theta CCMP2712]|uniref:DAGKc domain-containing protein n=1 Tax=Guillardia theta (strain CCMP2712) TaxID=905079 RepID=L1IBU8_GUITC|nr:hypothetical protein GUITHDRAFT_120265 [Guillardia theta CCMP2712]EKX33572.1 hypothetical protein GUITHDRAFT_120265 [Guillardia theta CCMP2712]|eukprot:XP_005820552.1 hypothetical protein GUITHDRAFT_120265 [Guillardia theta CCMP2712]